MLPFFTRFKSASAEDLEKIGGADGYVVTAVAKEPLKQAFNGTKNDGTMVLVGMPPENIELPIFDIVVRQVHITGSLVDTRKDLAEALSFAADGKINVDLTLAKLEDINKIFEKMKSNEILGRVVLKMV